MRPVPEIITYQLSLYIQFFFTDWLSVWCVAFFVDFGHVEIPNNLNVPPSLRMLGVEPQTKLNCEVLDSSQGFEVRWAIAGTHFKEVSKLTILKISCVSKCLVIPAEAANLSHFLGVT